MLRFFTLNLGRKAERNESDIIYCICLQNLPSPLQSQSNNMAFSSNVVEYELSRSIEKPFSLTMTEDGVLWVGSKSGLHRISTEGQIISTVNEMKTCIDVAVWSAQNRVVALFDGGGPRKGPESQTNVVIFDASDPRSPMHQRSIPNDFGRPRRIAISKSGYAFMTTKHEDPRIDPKRNSLAQKVQPPKSSLYKIEMTDWVNGGSSYQQIVHISPGNMWYLAIAKNHEFLLVSDMPNKDTHSVDVYDLAGGHLRKIIQGKESAMGILGTVCWPRGLALDQNDEHLYVVDEDMRIQKFRVEDSQFQGLICQLPTETPLERGDHVLNDMKPLVCVNNKLYSVGFKSRPVNQHTSQTITTSYLFVIPC